MGLVLLGLVLLGLVEVAEVELGTLVELVVVTTVCVTGEGAVLDCATGEVGEAPLPTGVGTWGVTVLVATVGVGTVEDCVGTTAGGNPGN